MKCSTTIFLTNIVYQYFKLSKELNLPVYLCFAPTLQIKFIWLMSILDLFLILETPTVLAHIIISVELTAFLLYTMLSNFYLTFQRMAAKDLNK